MIIEKVFVYLHPEKTTKNIFMKTAKTTSKTAETPKKISKFGMAMEKHQGLVKIVDMRAVMK